MEAKNQIKELLGNYSLFGNSADIHFFSNGHETDCVHIEDTHDTVGIVRSLGRYFGLQYAEIVRLTCDKRTSSFELNVEF